MINKFIDNGYQKPNKKNKVTKKGNDMVFPQRNRVTPLFLDNVITANKTDADGNIINMSPDNAIIARNEVNANHK